MAKFSFHLSTITHHGRCEVNSEVTHRDLVTLTVFTWHKAGRLIKMFTMCEVIVCDSLRCVWKGSWLKTHVHITNDHILMMMMMWSWKFQYNFQCCKLVINYKYQVRSHTKWNLTLELDNMLSLCITVQVCSFILVWIFSMLSRYSIDNITQPF